MKRIILIALMFLLPLSLFSYEISFNKKFTKTVVPDLLTTYVSINIENKDETFINEKIEIFNKYIKNNTDVIKKDGTFTLSPKYRYYKDKQEFIGYVGSLRYAIKSKNAKYINNFIDDLIVLKEKADSRKVKVTFSNVRWIASDILRNNSIDDLRMSAIMWIESYSNSLTTTLSKDCQIKQININNVNSINRQNFMQSEAMSFSLNTKAKVSPINSNKEISINPNFVLECK